MLTPQEEQASRAARFGLPPEPPVDLPPAVGLPPEREGVWSALRLYDFAPAPLRYEMPGGGAVWVHPLSDDEITWLNLQAAREIKALRLEGEQAEYAGALQQARAQVWQVILSCRQSEDEGSPLVFRFEDAPALRRNRGFWHAVRNICRLSDSIGADEAPLLETMRDFFGELGEGLHSLSSSSSNGAGETGSLVALTRLGSLVSSIRRRGKLTQADLTTLRALLEAPAQAEPTPTSAPSSDPGRPGPMSDSDAGGG